MELFELEAYTQQEFTKIIARSAEISQKEFSNCRFIDCDFTSSVFTHSSFTDCTFLRCNLANCNVTQCSFQNVLVHESKCVGIAFTNINSFLIELTFTKCHIELCDFSHLNLKKTIFTTCTIQECDFIHTNLTNADFSNSDLKNSRFKNANVTGANFMYATSYYIDPTENIVTHAKFTYPEVLNLLAKFEIEIV